MYLATIGRREHTAKGKLSAVGANVFALGAVSLVTDVSSEMVTAILPVYLVLGLHLSPAAYGSGFLGPNISNHYGRYSVAWTVGAWKEAGLMNVGVRSMSLGGGLVMWAQKPNP